MVVDGRAVEREAKPAAEKPSGAVRRRRGGTENRLAAGALPAETAARHEGEDDVVALAYVGHSWANRLDDPRGLVPEHHRHGTRPRAVDDGEVRVAEPGRRNPDLELAAPRRRQLELLDRQRLRFGVGPGAADLVQDAAAGDHERKSATSGLKRSGSSRKRRWPAPANVSKRTSGMRSASRTPFS